MKKVGELLKLTVTKIKILLTFNFSQLPQKTSLNH